jgi:hypothetical protein
VSRAATAVAVTVVTATTMAGMPKRMMCANESMSLVVRATRSPVPARSTVDRGRRTDEVMKSSRRRAKMRSDNTNEARLATQVSTVWVRIAATSSPMRTSTRRRLGDPVVTSCTTWPTTHGPTRATRAAMPCQSRTQVSGPAVVAQQLLAVGSDRRGGRDRQGACRVVGAAEER